MIQKKKNLIRLMKPSSLTVNLKLSRDFLTQNKSLTNSCSNNIKLKQSINNTCRCKVSLRIRETKQ